MELPRAARREEWGVMIYKKFYFVTGRVSEMDGGNDCITWWTYFMPLNCILQNGNVINSILSVFYLTNLDEGKKQTA